MVPLSLKVLAKFGFCSNCSQKLDECSLSRARKIFATARMLGFSLIWIALDCSKFGESSFKVCVHNFGSLVGLENFRSP